MMQKWTRTHEPCESTSLALTRFLNEIAASSLDAANQGTVVDFQVQVGQGYGGRNHGNRGRSRGYAER